MNGGKDQTKMKGCEASHKERSLEGVVHLRGSVRLLAMGLSDKLGAGQHLTLASHFLILGHAFLPLLQPAVLFAAVQLLKLHHQ